MKVYVLIGNDSLTGEEWVEGVYRDRIPAEREAEKLEKPHRRKPRYNRINFSVEEFEVIENEAL